MYGWDSYFIVRGLLRSGRVELARGMVDNFFFEIEHYGAMLNANRTYYLTRSQPPFLSSMFVDVYDALQKSGKQIQPGWPKLTLIWKKIMRCGTVILIWPARLDYRDITILGKARRRKPQRMNRDPIARCRPTFFPSFTGR